MKKVWTLSLVCAVVLSLAAALMPVKTAGQRNKLRKLENPIPGQYIVVLNEHIVGESAVEPVIETEAAYLSSVYGGDVKHVYASALKGFATRMSAKQAEALSLDERVLYVEEDAEVSIASTQIGPGWHLDRVDQRSMPLNTTYNYTQTGAGVHAYVLDTGIRTTHAEFGGRASVAYDPIGDGQNGQDCNGHGTHVAGIVGGSTYGVAKSVSLHAVRVLGCSGSGSVSDMVAGVNWVTANRINPAVVNISFIVAGSVSALETAVTNSVNSGVTYAVAAGNSAGDACGYSPARTPAAITVAASANADDRALYSNYGSCVDIFAPGDQVISSWIGSDTAARELSGTSMSAPMVAGVAALYLQANPTASSATVEAAIKNSSTAGVMTNLGAGSPNKLLYSFVTGAPPPTPTPTPSPTATPTPNPTPTPSPTPVQHAQLRVRKRIQNSTSTTSTVAFPYSTVNLPTPSFALTDNETFTDASVMPSNQQGNINVTEASVEGFQLVSISCTENNPNSTVDLVNRRVTINADEGETIDCTFTSEPVAPTAADATVSGRIVNQSGRGVRGVYLTLYDAGTGETLVSVTNSFGFYSFSNLNVTDFYQLTAFSTKRVSISDPVRTFTLNDDLAGVNFTALDNFR
jgi:subtilisin family serine protease